jgi:hypothetical protein
MNKEQMEEIFCKTGFFTRKGKNNMMKTFSYTKGDPISPK